MDNLWFRIIDVVGALMAALDAFFSPLDALGPAPAIFGVAFFTVGLTQLLKRFVPTTRRYRHLKQRFEELVALRREATKTADREKGNRLARNIDQAELNQVYYNYFFEGFLHGILTRYIPFFSMLAYVNESYRPERLAARFGKNHIFRWGQGSDALLVGALFWFVLSAVLIWIIWFAVSKAVAARKRKSRAIA